MKTEVASISLSILSKRELESEEDNIGENFCVWLGMKLSQPLVLEPEFFLRGLVHYMITNSLQLAMSFDVPLLYIYVCLCICMFVYIA